MACPTVVELPAGAAKDIRGQENTRFHARRQGGGSMLHLSPMMHGHVDVTDSLAVADFLDRNIEFLPEKSRIPFLRVLKTLEEGASMPRPQLAEMMKDLGAAVWPMRRALEAYLAGEGVEDEWNAMLELVRPTTALLLKRLRKNMGTKTLDETLASSDAAYAIHEREEEEITHLRPEVRLRIWKVQGASLASRVAAEKKTLAELQKRFHLWRSMSKSSAKMEASFMEKVERYEERVLIGGEMISLESLDGELMLDRADLEIPPTDEAL